GLRIAFVAGGHLRLRSVLPRLVDDLINQWVEPVHGERRHPVRIAILLYDRVPLVARITTYETQIFPEVLARDLPPGACRLEARPHRFHVLFFVFGGV